MQYRMHRLRRFAAWFVTDRRGNAIALSIELATGLRSWVRRRLRALLAR